MGPQKLDYVMSQLVIRFPKIRDNRYLYNIVEKTVFELNEEKQKQKLIQEFEAKYGKDACIDYIDNIMSSDNKDVDSVVDESVVADVVVEQEVPVSTIESTSNTNVDDVVKTSKLKSF